MSKALWLGIAAAVLLGFSTTQVLARGGGHGGGHHGGGHHGGGHHAGGHAHHSEHHHSHTGHHDHHGFHRHNAHWAHHNRPFSRGWYGNHHRAWGYGWGGWGWGNPWAVSTFGATAAWLGLEAAEPLYGNNAARVSNVLTSETANTQLGSEPGIAPALSPEQIEAATKLAASGQADPDKSTAFLPLGVFSIAPEGQSEASALVQLTVSKAGIIRGTYYDLLTDHDQPIRGAVDKKTQQAAFTFGEQGKVTFETTLASLTNDEGSLSAHFANGKTANWSIARYAQEPTAGDEDADDAAQSAPAGEAAPQ